MYERRPRFPAVSAFMAVLGFIASCSIPCVAASHIHPSAARTHAIPVHAARGVHGSTKAHAVAFRTGHGRHAQYVERAVVHHEAAPAMDTARATEIQTALIRSGYLSGEPTGMWDSESVAAMQKLQDDNGWQTKYTPDSRALVKLGLGAGATPTQATVAANDAAPAVQTQGQSQAVQAQP